MSDSDIEYSGFFVRLAAQIIDTLLLIAIFFIIILLVVGTIKATAAPQAGGSPPPDVFNVFGAIASFFGRIIYFPLFEISSYQATPGKMVVGAKVTDLEGNKIGFMKALGRNLGKILSGVIWGIGFLMAGFTSKKQALHDKLAGCLVVNA